MEAGLAREDLFITTKAFVGEMSEKGLFEAFERSTMKLGVDVLDLYLIHMPLGDWHGAWRAMEALYEEGRVRAVGVCNFTVAQLADLRRTAKIEPMVNQIECHPHYQRAAEVAYMRALGIQPEAWAPFAEGLDGTFADSTLTAIGAR